MDNPNSRFLKRYLIFVISFAVVLLGITVFLWFKLAGYQKNIEAEENAADPGSIEVMGEFNDSDEELRAQHVFTEYASELNADSIVNLYFANHPERLDSVETVSALVNDSIILPGFESYKASDFSMDAPKYVIMAGGEIVGEFTLARNGSEWNVASSEIFLGGDNILTVKAPATSGLMINGHEIADGSLESTESVAELYAYEEDLVNPVIFKNYSISGMISPQSEVTADGGNMAYDGIIYEYSSEGSENKEKANDFVRALLHYFAMGKENTAGNQGTALSYVASGSNASKVIHETASGLEWVGANYSLSYTTEPSEPYKLADNCYFIDVEYFLTDSSKVSAQPEDETEEAAEPEEDENSHGVYRVYFLDQGKGYAIVEFAGI